MSTEDARRPGTPVADLDRVDASGWETRDFPRPTTTRGPGTQVVIRQSVLEEIYAHGESHPTVEVCGVLVGNGFRDEAGPFVYVEGRIEGKHAGNESAHVTFTAETWNHIHEVLDRRHPEQRILGWYHTHPGFGIFLSNMDLFIQENFFGAPEQVAFVFDPQGGDEGLFVWREGVARREPFVVERDVPSSRPPRLTISGEAAGGGHDDQAEPRRGSVTARRRRRLRPWLLAALVVLTAAEVVWLHGLPWAMPSPAADGVPADGSPSVRGSRGETGRASAPPAPVTPAVPPGVREDLSDPMSVVPGEPAPGSGEDES